MINWYVNMICGLITWCNAQSTPHKFKHLNNTVVSTLFICIYVSQMSMFSVLNIQ